MNDVIVLAFLIIILITFLFNLRSLGSLLLFIGAIVLGISNLSFLFNCNVSTIVMVLLLGIGLLFLLMYGCISEEREKKQNKNSQSGLA